MVKPKSTPAILLLASGFAFASIAPALAGPSDPEPQYEDNWFEQHAKNVNNTLANPQIPILFFGDSITDFWDEDGVGGGRPIWDELYAPRGAVNYGILWNQVQNVLWQVLNGEVRGLSPKLVVLKIGTNNLYFGDSSADIAEGIETLVSTLRRLVPTAKVLVLGILPRTGRKEMDYFDKIVDINYRISRLHNGHSVFFLDMFANFVGDVWGTIRSELMYDGLHLTLEGYRKWADTMGPLFDKLLE